MKFEWDRRKAAANLKKHGIGFQEAMSVFADPLEITIPDPDHSDDEARYLSVGVTTKNRLVVVA